MAYVALHVEQGRGAHAIDAMRTLGLTGFSVTMPHKFDVAESVDHLTPQALALKSCNTVFRDVNNPDVLWGDSTDGDGFVAGLQSIGQSVSGANVVVIGAGGAGRAVIEAMGRAGAADIAILNRDVQKATDAATLASVARVGANNDVVQADLVVNATSLGMQSDDHLPCEAALLQPNQFVADLIYHPARTRFLAAAAERGAHTMNGLPMLLQQAALQFQRWTALDAPIDAMRRALETELQFRASA
jgi:shikimate dehydrogenase